MTLTASPRAVEEPQVRDQPGGHRWPALDGIRAFAVVGVILYHAGISWIPGGLLGVDAFFVLSGFLITSLLLGERARAGRISLGRFWGRRARRLLPALVLLLVAIAFYARFVADPTDRASVRADGISALFYVANWRFAFSDQGYFAHFAAPSPLLHLWSLGVEEQFYLLWPLVVVGALGVSRGRRGRYARAEAGNVRRLLIVAVAGVVVSTALMAVLYERGVGTSRLYYGTDTRAAALLVGAALAAYRVLRPASGGSRHRLLAVAGVLGALGTPALWLRVGGETPWLYDGGFLLVAVAVAAVVRSVVEVPSGLLARFLALPPLVAVGRISYGLYLWHWPVLLTLTHARTGLDGGVLLAVRLAVTVAAATASYLLVEQPIRTGRVRIRWPRVSVPAVAVLVVAALVVGGWGGAAPSAANPAAAALTPQQLASQQAVREENAFGARARGPGKPLMTLLVGDSVAFTLGFAITPTLLRRYGQTLLDRGELGCGIAPAGRIVSSDSVPEAERSDCAQWPQRWAATIKRSRPDVVALLVGRWETVDRRVNGRVTHIGEPDFDAAMSAQLDKAIGVLSAGGASVALLTTPCFEQTELPDGSIPDIDDPARVIRFNELLRQAAARHPDRARVIDLNGIVCPGGTYQRDIDGVQVRTADGVHFDVASGPVVAPTLLTLTRLMGFLRRQ